MIWREMDPWRGSVECRALENASRISDTVSGPRATAVNENPDAASTIQLHLTILEPDTLWPRTALFLSGLTE